MPSISGGGARAPVVAPGGEVSPGRLLEMDGAAGLQLGSQHLMGSGLTLVAGLLVLGMLDWVCRKWDLERELMMTRDELQEELARQEQPEIISRKRRGFARRLVATIAHGGGGVE